MRLLILLTTTACTGASVPVDWCGTATGAATVDAVDSGMGITSITSTVANCTAQPVTLFRDACGGREMGMELLDEGTDTWEALQPRVPCDVAGLDPEVLEAFATVDFDTAVWGPDLCEIGGGTYRATYGVGPEDCGEAECFEPVVSGGFFLYCEG